MCVFSRMPTETERRDSQAEKEALGVVWSCEMAAIWLMGSHFCIVVDNRPVMLIYSNAKSKPLARIERWALRLTSFDPEIIDLEIVARPGVSNMANYYSRSPGGAGVLAYLEEIKSEQNVSMVSASSHTARNDYTRESRGNEPRP